MLITDSGQRTGTGSALMAMKEAGEQLPLAGWRCDPGDRYQRAGPNVRYARLAGDFVAAVKAGEESAGTGQRHA